MKKSSIFAILFVMIASAICFAQTAPMAVNKMVLTGKVKRVMAADAAKGTQSEIILTDASGKDLTVIVMPTTPIVDKDSKPVMFDKLASGEVVAVQYKTTAVGAVEAIAIKIAG